MRICVMGRMITAAAMWASFILIPVGENRGQEKTPEKRKAVEVTVDISELFSELQLTSNALIPCVRPKDRDGVCHHLANEDRLLWTKS